MHEVHNTLMLKSIIDEINNSSVYNSLSTLFLKTKFSSVFYICLTTQDDFPKTIASKAMRTYIPYSVCLKYAARGSESNSVLISKTLGNGCMTTIRRLALVINFGVTTYSPQDF